MQYLTQRCRAAFCEGKAMDVDMVCSCPSILVMLADRWGLGNHLNIFRHYASHSKIWRAFFQEYYHDMGEADAKTLPLKCMFGFKPWDDNPLLWSLKAEVVEFLVAALQLPQNSHLRAMYDDQQNPLMSKLAHLLFEHEAKYLEDFLSFLKEADNDVEVSCTIFDGAIVVPSTVEKMEVLKTKIGEWNQKMPVQVAIKDWGAPFQ